MIPTVPCRRRTQNSTDQRSKKALLQQNSKISILVEKHAFETNTVMMTFDAIAADDTFAADDSTTLDAIDTSGFFGVYLKY